MIKASGLAAGKGVIVPETPGGSRGRPCAPSWSTRDLGSAGNEVILEERLSGEEVSLLAFTDGVTVRADAPGAGSQAAVGRRPRPQHRRDGRLRPGPGLPA